jgi:hypothetical protein
LVLLPLFDKKQFASKKEKLLVTRLHERWKIYLLQSYILKLQWWCLSVTGLFVLHNSVTVSMAELCGPAGGARVAVGGGAGGQGVGGAREGFFFFFALNCSGLIMDFSTWWEGPGRVFVFFFSALNCPGLIMIFKTWFSVSKIET